MFSSISIRVQGGVDSLKKKPDQKSQASVPLKWQEDGVWHIPFLMINLSHKYVCTVLLQKNSVGVISATYLSHLSTLRPYF